MSITRPAAMPTSRTDPERDLDPAERFRTQTWTAGVIGLGYVGLPLSVTAADADLPVIGYDIDASKTRALSRGSSHVEDVSDLDLQRAIDNGARFTADEEALREADALFIAVPSPLSRHRQPDMSYIEAAMEIVARVARPGQLISLESTTYPGTTEDQILPTLQRAGLQLDRDVFVSFSPERVDPGNVLLTSDIPKVVGGVTEMSGEVAAAAYRRLVAKVHLVGSARAAELTKLLENTYRAVNIALVNELAQLAHVLDIDIWEVVEAAGTKPFGFQPFFPGPGVGGHCIPLDPQYLAWRAREVRAATRFIDLAEEINLHMPDYVASRIIDELNDRGLPTSGTRVLIVGVAYKRNIADARESPSVDVMDRLARRGARLGILDPCVPMDQLESFGHEVVTGDQDLQKWSMAVILTDHDGVDYTRLAREVELVFDTRGVYRRLAVPADNVVHL